VIRGSVQDVVLLSLVRRLLPVACCVRSVQVAILTEQVHLQRLQSTVMVKVMVMVMVMVIVMVLQSNGSGVIE
jgi:hypothetical protein